MSFAVALDAGRVACAASTEAFLRAVDGLSEHALLDASRCHGWSRLDVVVHLVAGWQEDYLAVWAVENVVHHLDLCCDEPAPSGALGLARTTNEPRVDRTLPASWSDLDATLVGAGRAPVPDGFGPLAARLPALGSRVPGRVVRRRPRPAERSRSTLT